jgi:YVTN family beta-propeller protein
VHSRSFRLSRFATSALVALAGISMASGASAATAVNTVARMPPVVNADNLHSEAGAGHFSPAVKDALPRIYIPNLRSNDVYVIDPATFRVADRFHVGYSPAARGFVLGSPDLAGRQHRRGATGWQPDPNRSKDWKAGQGGHARRSIQHVFHA